MEFQEDFVPTKSSVIKGISSTIQTQLFTSYKSKAKKKDIKDDSASHSSTTDEFNIKQAKREVIKFGMSGLDSKKKEEYKIQLALKLGECIIWYHYFVVSEYSQVIFLVFL